MNIKNCVMRSQRHHHNLNVFSMYLVFTVVTTYSSSYVTGVVIPGRGVSDSSSFTLSGLATGDFSSFSLTSSLAIWFSVDMARINMTEGVKHAFRISQELLIQYIQADQKGD